MVKFVLTCLLLKLSMEIIFSHDIKNSCNFLGGGGGELYVISGDSSPCNHQGGKGEILVIEDSPNQYNYRGDENACHKINYNYPRE